MFSNLLQDVLLLHFQRPTHHLIKGEFSKVYRLTKKKKDKNIMIISSKLFINYKIGATEFRLTL